jgi:hypothetical protein
LDFSSGVSAGGREGIVYKYNAVKKEYEGMTSLEGHCHVHLNDEGRNNYERELSFNRMADRNLVSAVPVLISRHMSYYHNLELLYGVFEFYRDIRGKLWLVDARGLHFIPSAVHGSSGGGTEGGDVGGDRLYRYMSEEALHNLEVHPNDGEKCARMQENMRQHYKSMKDDHGIDDLLQKRDEAVPIRIPVFIGTNRKALFETFGLPEGAHSLRAQSAGRKDHRTDVHPRRPVTAKASKVSAGGPARQMVLTPRPPSRNALAYKVVNPRHAQSAQTHRDPMPVSIPSTRSQTPQPWSRASTPAPAVAAIEPKHGTCRQKSRDDDLEAVQHVEAKAGQSGFEIVPTVDMPRLLHGAGPFMLPESSTLCKQGPMSVWEPLAGLQEHKEKSRTKAKLQLLKPASTKDSAPRHHFCRVQKPVVKTKTDPSKSGLERALTGASAAKHADHLHRIDHNTLKPGVSRGMTVASFDSHESHSLHEQESAGTCPMNSRHMSVFRPTEPIKLPQQLDEIDE